MKIAHQLRPKRFLPKDKRGVALVTVLTVMSLTTILVLTFFSLASSEHRASNTYSNGLQAQQVAEQAVNMVIAQIREATITQDSGGQRLWASQPGAVRTWNTGGNFDTLYKLYSDETMRDGSSNSVVDDYQDLSNWVSQPEHFVDLNEPVIRGDKVFYPIVHPAAESTPRWPKELGDDRGGVEGFDFDAGAIPSSELAMNAAQVLSRDSDLEQVKGHVPMPVRWLYQLADGTVGVLKEGASAEGRGAQFIPVSGNGDPSEKNPIVARFAFWADDETSKLNINTHAGGLAWDIPKAGGDLDMDMGRYQPAQHEWQRYPGHPATTHLGPALAPGVLDIVNDREAMEMLYGVVPRVVGGGSESGTRLIDTRNPKEANGLIPDKEPLFPTIDDIIMRSDREPHEYPDAQGNPIPAEDLSEYLERSRFFISVNSRAPETNMFNLPRVAMWPIFNTPRSSRPTSDYQRRLTAFDRLIHYCSSVGGPTTNDLYDYIFKREKADSATWDYDNISRNKEVFEYLLTLLESDIPGYGKSFTDKYGKKDAQQLLTLIFDYIRTTNLHDDSIFVEDFEDAFTSQNTSSHRTYTNPRDKDEPGFGHKGHGQVTPIVIESGSESTKGMGRYYSLASAGILVACAGQTGAVGGQQFPGITQYRVNGWAEPPSANCFTNIPPIPPGLTKDSDAGYPQWLKVAKMGNPEEFEAAFDPANWNWQLAFLNQGYRDAVLASPNQGTKYNQSVISAAMSDEMRLKDGERLAQAIFVFNLFCPSIGWGSINPDLEVHITANSGMSFSDISGQPVHFLGFSNQGLSGSGGGVTSEQNTYVWATNWGKPVRAAGARAWGGMLSFGYALSGRQPMIENNKHRNKHVWWQMEQSGTILNNHIRSRLTPVDIGYKDIPSALNSVKAHRNIGGDASKIANAYRYDLVTVPFKISDQEVVFNGGEVTFKIYNGGTAYTEASANDVDESNSKTPVQEVTLAFPPFTQDAPRMLSGMNAHINEFDAFDRDSAGIIELGSVTADPGNPSASALTKAVARGASGIAPNPNNSRSRGRMSHVAIHWNAGDTFIRPGDVVQTVGIPHGDARIPATQIKIEAGEYFAPHHKYNKEMMAHSWINSAGVALHGFNPRAQGEDKFLIIPDLPKVGNIAPYRNRIPLPFSSDMNDASKYISESIQRYGDFDNGSGEMIDGPYINKPDEGNVHALKTRFTQEINHYWEERRNYGEFPYFSHPDLAEAGGPAYFSPNRIVSGPGMFGSLPSAANANEPWRTLLFRPNVVGNGYSSHPGASKKQGGEDPPDHLLMDLFWMPVVEPYAISEPLSTGGKVNMNYQMVPFVHVTRNTALRGVFRSEFMVCIPAEWHVSYKHDRGRGRGWHWRDNPYGGELQGVRLRSAIVDQDTLAQFEERFDSGRDIFRSATEICEIHLIGEQVANRIGATGLRGDNKSYTPSVEQMETGKFWRDHSLVGDNSRERPYTNIHQRLTTKSNTFKVHYRAQVLKQSRRENSSDYKYWNPEVDSVVAEYRGDSIVERYVEPNSTDIPDYASMSVLSNASLDDHYQFRVVNPRRFAP